MFQIDRATADAIAPLLLATPADWTGLPDADKDRHLYQGALYLHSRMTCESSVDAANPPTEIQQALAMAAFLDRERALLGESSSTVAGGSITLKRVTVGPITTQTNYSGGATTSAGNRTDMLRALVESGGCQYSGGSSLALRRT